MKNKLLLIISLFLSSLIIAQPANDNCTGATNLGTLGTPGACGNGIKNGAITTVAATNIGSTPENPYTTLAGCGMASPANSVWYKFTAPPSGFGVNIAITNATFANPNIALYNGANCNSLAGINCIVGTGGAATLNVTNGIVPGQTYYIFISGNTGQSGTFTLKVNAYQDCANCLNASHLTVTPLPVNGAYQPGQTVNFCFHIDQWTQTTNNWLHGVQMSFGPGWNLASLTTTPPPPYISTAGFWGGGTPASCGNWQYYPAGITSTANNNAWPAGFYFNGTYTTDIFGAINGCGSAADGNPGNNFGDGVSSSGTVYNPGAGDWNFCWSIQVISGCNPGMSLNVAVNTSGDGESGAWTSTGCTNDPPTTFSALISCCPPNMASTATCPAAATGTATATPIGATGPYVYSWATGGQTTQTATGLVPGTYTVTVTDHNLCAVTNTVTVSAYTTPVVTPVSNITSCIGASVSVPAFASTPAGATFAWTNSNPAIGLAASGTGNIPTFTATNATGAPITATITVTPTSAAPQSCPGPPITFTITVSPVLTVTVNSPAICAGGTATLTAAGATTYTWSAGATSTGVTTATASPATTTTYTVTGTSGTCTATAVATVSVTGNLTITVNSPSVCSGGTATLTAGGATTYTWSAGATSTGVNTATATPATTTTYTVTGSTGACTGTAVSTVTVTGNLTITVNSPAICTGQTANLTATGATTYVWTAGATSSGANTATAAPAATTSYTVTGSTGPCTGTAVSTVTVNPLPTVTVPANITICNTGSIPATNFTSSIVGSTFTWTNNNTAIGIGATGSGNVPSFTATNTGTAPITATITVTPTGPAPTNCIGTSSIYTITVNPTPTVIVPANIAVCNNGIVPTTNFTSSVAGSTFTWTNNNTAIGIGANGAGNISSFTATNLGTAPITASITVTPTGPAATNCLGTSSVYTITVNPIPNVTVPANITICNGGSIPATSFTSNVVGSTFAWTNNNTAIGIGASGTGNLPTFVATNTGATAITANITVTPTGPATTNCIGTPSTYTITVNPTPPAPTVVTPVTYCQNDAAVALTATGTGLLWYTSATGGVGSATAPTPSTATAGTTSYFVSQTIATCEGPRAQIDVVINPTPTPPTVTSPVNYCLNDPTVALTATGSNLLWYTTAVGGVGSATAPTPSSATAGMTSYWVSQTLLGCEGPRAQIDVNITALPVVGVTSPTICAGTAATITANGATTYTWSAGATSSGVTTATASPATTTSYTVTGTTLGCINTAVSTVTVNPIPVVIVNSPVICAGQTAALTANGGTTYTWSAGATATGANTASASPAANSSYTVTGTTLGCSGTAVSAVTVNPLPTATVSGGGSGCFGTVFPSVIITLTGASPWNITYSDGTNSTTITTAVSPYVIANPGVGTYVVTSISNANCVGTYSGTALVTSNPIPVPSFTAPNNGCKPFCTTFTDGSTITTGTITGWNWSFGDGGTATSQNPNYCYNSPGIYSVTLTVTSSAGCSATVTNSNMITVYQVPHASFSCPNYQSILDPLVQFTNYSSGATSYVWNFGDPYSSLPNNTSTVTSPQHLYSALGDYCISLAVTNGHCYDTTQVCLVIQPEFIFYIPNAFSPNGDGINDEFYGKGEGINSYEMWVYDRWGNKVFYGDALDQHWDGTMKGRKVQEDVYVYVVKLFDWKNDEHKYLGTVTVVR